MLVFGTLLIDTLYTNYIFVKKLFFGLLVILSTSQIFAQANEYTISGTIYDNSSGESLIGANILIEELQTGGVTNAYGFYSITLPAGEYTLRSSYIGFSDFSKQISLTENIKLDIELDEEGTKLTDVVITAEKKNKNIESIEMSKEKISIAKIKSIPAVFGEVDIIKAIQLLPGVSATGEGQSGFNVRGGSVDQNLILLDEATVYNAAHFLGFFSVFNPDVVKNVEIYKGGIPAEYGGRLSSVLDVRMNEGNKKKFAATGGIGTISSRLTLEGPLKKNESSFIVAGRRTYADQFLRFAKDTSIRNNKVFFYDLNAKLNYKLGEKDRIFLSGYFGDDVFEAGGARIQWGNATGTARWNHIYNDRLFSNFTFIYSDYDYSLGASNTGTGFKWDSNIKDISGKVDFNYFWNSKNNLKFGAQLTDHEFEPGKIEGIGESIFGGLDLDNKDALEGAVYLSNEQKISTKFTALYGLRYSVFANTGGSNVYSYDENFQVKDTSFYKKGEIYNQFGNLEPRLGLRLKLGEDNSVKASYNRMAQYIHLASNGISSSPLDIWFPSSTNVKPQLADQVALGYFHNFQDDAYETSIEVYYKKIQNAIDFKDHASLLLNQFIEGELRFGEARAYGAEFLVKKNTGRLTGWVGYTLAKSERKIGEINRGEWYNATWDKTHDASIVLSYELNPRINLSANWVYATGRAVTFPTGKYEYNGWTVPVYSDRNAERMPAYHRGDLGFTLKNKPKDGRKFFWDMNVSIYNVYNRKNAYSINFREDPVDSSRQIAEKTYIFPILPSVTYNFKF